MTAERQKGILYPHKQRFCGVRDLRQKVLSQLAGFHPAAGSDLFGLKLWFAVDFAQKENDLLSGNGADAVFRGGSGTGNKPRPESGLLEKLPEGGSLLCFPGLHVSLGEAPRSGTPLEQKQKFRFHAGPPEGDDPAGFLKDGINGADKILLLKMDGLGDLP